MRHFYSSRLLSRAQNTERMCEIGIWMIKIIIIIIDGHFPKTAVKSNAKNWICCGGSAECVDVINWIPWTTVYLLCKACRMVHNTQRSEIVQNERKTINRSEFKKDPFDIFSSRNFRARNIKIAYVQSKTFLNSISRIFNFQANLAFRFKFNNKHFKCLTLRYTYRKWHTAMPVYVNMLFAWLIRTLQSIFDADCNWCVSSEHT